MDIYRTAKRGGKFPLLATGTEVNNTEIIELKKMILTHLLLQRLQYFRAQLLYISTQNPPARSYIFPYNLNVRVWFPIEVTKYNRPVSKFVYS